MAQWTGLAKRGPSAGFLTVFPDAVDGIWDDTGLGRQDELDDAAFIAGVVRELGQSSLEGAPAVLLVGLSNGATFAEHLVRHDQIAARGLVLVAGTARENSRRTAPRPPSRCGLLLIVGIKDPSVPYRRR